MNLESVPSGASAAVLKHSEPIAASAVAVQGPDFDNALDLQNLLDSYERIGFQATSLGRAIKIVNQMVSLITSHTEVRAGQN